MNSLADLMSLLNLRMRFADLAQLGFVETTASPSRLYQGMSFGWSFQCFRGSSFSDSEPEEDSPSPDSSALAVSGSHPSNLDNWCLAVSGSCSALRFLLSLGPGSTKLISAKYNSKDLDLSCEERSESCLSHSVIADMMSNLDCSLALYLVMIRSNVSDIGSNSCSLFRSVFRLTPNCLG